MASVANTSNLKTAPSPTAALAKPSIAYNQVDNSFRLTTPENISFEYQLAGPFRRILPYLLDLLIVFTAFLVLMGAYWVFAIVVGIIFAFLGVLQVAEFLLAVGFAVSYLALFLAYWFYGTYMETNYNGRTFGKMIANLRVLSTDGHAIDGVQATLRNFFRGADLMPFIPLSTLLENNEIAPWPIPTAIFGLIVMSISPKFQRLGDLVAGTMVVNEDSSRDPHLQTFTDSRVPQLAELIPGSFYVSNSLGKAVAAYVERREQLGIARAGEIAAKLAGTLREEFGLAADTDSDLLICSLYYKIFVGDAPQESLYSDSPNSDSPYSQTPPQNRYEPAPHHVPFADPLISDASESTAPTLPVAPEINTSTDSEPE